MTRKHFFEGEHGPKSCPTCGGAQRVTVHRGGIARVLGHRVLRPDRVWHEIQAVDARWRPALKATHAWQGDDGVYHEPDLIGQRLVLAGWRAETAVLTADDDQGRSSVRVYWPQQRYPQHTMAICPDSWHDRFTMFGFPRVGKPPRTDDYRYRRAPKGVAAQRKAEAKERRKAKARRHKDRQAKR